MDSPVLDPVSRLLLALAPDDAQRVALVDADPALDGASADRWDDVRAYRDRLDAGPSTDTLAQAVAGADTVLLALPKSLGALDEIACTVAGQAAPGVRLVAAGRVKHMTPTQNDVLRRWFADVHAGRGVGKCRPLYASSPTPGQSTWPRTAVEESGLVLAAHGATFGGPRVDAGTRLLLTTADRWPAGDALDVGCGNGILTATLARRGNTATGIDVSRAAVAATRETLSRNGLHADVRLADGLAGTPDASADLVATNPPFHVGTAKDSTPALAMIDDAARVLRPGSELWLVFNAHLPYLQAARAAFGRDGVSIAARDREFVVARARRS